MDTQTSSGKQGDQRVDIAGIVGADELGHERLLGG
jgi:hypothetical protein